MFDGRFDDLSERGIDVKFYSIGWKGKPVYFGHTGRMSRDEVIGIVERYKRITKDQQQGKCREGNRE